MKNKTSAPFLALAAFLTLTCANAAPLSGTTAVQAKPDAKAPAIAYLKAGTEPPVASNFHGALPTGWTAVELSGPFEGYVTNNDISKNLDVSPGVAIRLEPKADAPVLTTMERGDKAEISGIPRGKWMQVKVEKKIIGFINVGTSSSAANSASSSNAPMAIAAPAISNAPGHAAPMVDSGDGGSAALPRLLQGKLVSTKRPLAPRRPYDYQLNDASGARLAYVDVSRLLLTEQIEKYVDRTVVIFGTAKNETEAKGVVIHAESLQLK